MSYLRLPSTVTHRLVQSGGSYPSRPATGSAEFLGSLDPGSLLLSGDTWTQLPAGSGAPNAPTIGIATAGNTSATVAFTPASTGTTATSFTATSTPGGITATGSGSPLTLTGLTNGTAYTFTVHASNSSGSSAESSASNSVTPTGGSALTDDFTGSNGAAWSTTVWKAVAPNDGTATADIQSNQGRFTFTSGGFSEGYTRRFNMANSANWRIRVHLVTPPAVNWVMRLYLQATDWPAGQFLPNTAYFSFWNSSGYNVANIISGSATELFAFTSLSATDRWMDLKVVGSVLKVKAWTGTSANEPSSYTPVTNSSPIIGSGEAGLFFGATNTAGTIDYRIDDVLVDNNPVP